MARGRQRLGIVVATAVAAGVVLLASASAGVGAGGLAQLASPNDCISEADASLGCGTTDGTGLNGADWIAASPDGKNVYVASFSGAGAVAELARAADGTLSELGCVAASGTECGTTALGLSEATSVAVSPDGKNVYVTGDQDDTVMIFDRDAADGTLTPAGCVQDAAARFDRGCGTTVHGMGNAYQVVVSPDGKNVYVAAGSGGAGDGAVVELARASDGSLSQLASPNDCIEEQSSSTPVCGTTGTGLLAVTALALNPNDGGTSLYAVADTHAVQAGDAPGALATFTRDTTTGALTQTGCIGESTSVAGITECQSTRAAGLSDLVNVAVSPDGSTVYTASDDATGPIAEFARASDGSLTGLGCVDSGGAICGTTADGLASAFGVAVSPDGANVYVASAGASSYGGATPVAPGLVELTRASDGTLTGSGCIQQEGAANQTCQVTTGHGLGDALGVAVSPDGDNVYVATSSSGGAVAAFSRGGGSPPPPSNQAPTAAFTTSTSGRTVSFDAGGSSDADGSVASYAWDFGDGTTGTGDAPSHSYASSGTYTVTLTVTDNQGATASVTHGVTVTAPPPTNQPPTAAFTASVSGLTVSVDGSSSSDADGTVASYAWDFGDGATGTSATASHTYPAAGTYTVVLTATDDDGATATATHDVVVTAPPPNTPPTAAFAASAEALTVSLDASGSADSDGTVASYAWDFGDGATGTGATTTHAYSAAGTYTVSLTVTDDAGATATVTHDVTVGAPSDTATFAPAEIVPAGTTDGPLVLDDVNEDGHPDVVVAEPNGVGVLFGDGAGNLPTQHDYALPGTPTIVRLADTNADGKADIVATDGGGEYFTLLDTGPGAYGDAHSYFTAYDLDLLFLGDVTHDGVADAIAGLDNGYLVAVERGGGDGGFGPFQGGNEFVYGEVRGVALADLDGDGNADLIAAEEREADGSVTVRLGVDHYPYFVVSWPAFYGVPTPFCHWGDAPGTNDPLAISDLNGDGALDVVYMSPCQSDVQVLLGNGDGTFGTATVLPVGAQPNHVVTGDVNGDGIPDIVTAGADGVTVLLGNGDGTFDAGVDVPTPKPASAVGIADVNEDGLNDLVVNEYDATSGVGDLALLLNASHGTPSGNRPPAAHFTATANGLQVSADGSASTDPDGHVTRYSWNFGDGATAAGTTATHVYRAGGTFDVTLRVTDDDGALAEYVRAVSVAPHSITISKQGTGTGRVVGRAAGIDCGQTCTGDLPSTGDLTLTAFASTGSTFVGWSGGGCSGTGTCNVPGTADATVTAVFAKNGTLLWSRSFGGWAPNDPSPPQSELHGISCPSVALCVTVGLLKIDTLPAGVVFSTSTNPLASTPDWTPLAAQSDHVAPLAVSCATTSLCAVVDAQGDIATSTDPVGGHWTFDPVDGSYASLNGVSCPSASLCVAAGDGAIFASTNPAAGPTTFASQRAADEGAAFTGVSCPSASFCAVVDSLGQVFTATNPAGGTGAWSAQAIGTVDFSAGVPNVDISFTGISCPTASFCVAVDDVGDVLVSTDPTGGRTAWVASRVDSGRLNAISCASVSFCAAGDSANRLVTSNDPAGGSGAWASFAAPDPGTLFDLPGPYPILGVSCLQTDAAPTCAAVDTAGDVFAGRNPTLEVTTGGHGGGHVTSSPTGITCGSTCTHSFFVGDTVTLTPVPSVGSAFAGWSGGGCSGRGACTVTISGDTTVTATFALANTTAVAAPVTQPAGPQVIAPQARFTVSASQVPGSLSATMDASSSVGATGGYAWQFGDGTSGSGAKTTHLFPHAGTYPVRLTVTSGTGASDSTSLGVTVPAGAASTTATRGAAGTLTAGTGSTAPTVRWTSATFSQPVTVTVVPPAPGTLFSQPREQNASAVQLLVTTPDGKPVTRFAAPVELVFRPGPGGAVPAYSINGTSWTAMPRLAGTTLPAGFRDGWFSDPSGAIHVLTRHATYFAVLRSRADARPELVARVSAQSSVRLRGAHAVHVRVASTLPAAANVVVRARGAVLARATGRLRAGKRHVFAIRLGPHARPGKATVTVTVTAGRSRAVRVVHVRLRH